ncbi:MAG TPA: diguanylate cyclase [Rhodanobacter sp.]|nr:diguanylate cyclase [Rhodanobacter sp.]
MDRLRKLAVLDTEAEPLFDALTRAAAVVTGKPIALISLIDAHRQWFKSRLGLPDEITETPREIAFCAHTILDSVLLEVADAQQDPRFADNPLVTGTPDIRFYAGAPITLRDGSRLGSLCVIDYQPGRLDEGQRQTIQALAQVAADALELRRYALDGHVALQREAEALRQQMEAGRLLQQKLSASEAFLERTGQLAGVGGWELDLATRKLLWSDETCRIHDLPPGYQPDLDEAINFYAEEARPLMRDAVDKAFSERAGWDLQLPLITAQGRRKWVRAVGAVEYAEDGQPRCLAGAFQDVTLRARAVAALEASDRRFRKLFQYSLGLIYTHDREGLLLSVNPAAAKALGYSVGEMIGRPLTDFIRAELHESFHDYLRRISEHDSDAGSQEVIAKDGSLHMWQYHNVLDDDGDEPYVLGHAQDVTDRQQQENKLREWSVRDTLTGCFNRRYLTELNAEIMRERWGCIVIDLDHFKQVNDTYGHQRGDEVLVGMARFLSRHVRSHDAVIRLGGDEFLILLCEVEPGLTDTVVGRLEANRAAAPIEFTLGATTLEPGVSLETGLAEADRRLYQAREGRPPLVTA